MDDNTFMSNIIHVTGETFDKEVLQSKLPVLVDFWAAWCGPCRMMEPVLEDLAREFDGKLVIAKADIEDSSNRALAMKYEIRSIPNLKLFSSGSVGQEFIGYRDKNTFTRELKAALEK